MDRPSDQPLRVTIRDLRDARYCLAGVRPWFRRHGLDWQDFLARGIGAERLRATGDGLVAPVIAAAEARRAAEEAGAEGPQRSAAQITAQGRAAAGTRSHLQPEPHSPVMHPAASPLPHPASPEPSHGG